MKFDRLFQQDFKIVENKKKVFIIPAIILVAALIFGIVYHFVFGSSFNLGMDYTGGYKIQITLGNKLTDATYEEYKNLTVGIAENLKDDEGKSYGIKISSVQRQGEADTAGLLLKYKAVGSDELMEKINEKLQDELADSVFFFKPEITVASGNTSFTAKYTNIILAGDYNVELRNKLINEGYDVTSATTDVDSKTITVALGTAMSSDQVAQLVSLMTISDNYGGMVVDGGQTSSTVSGEILRSTLLAISIAIAMPSTADEVMPPE